MNLSRSLMLTSVFFLLQSPVHAQEVDGVFGFGYDFGGKTLGTVVFDNGDKEDIKSHEGLFIYGGADFALNPDLALRTTIGYKFDSVTASNGEAEFSRIPIDWPAD